MGQSQWGGERGRHDVYGPTPGTENIVHDDLLADEEQALTPAEIEVQQDQLAVDAMIAYILNDDAVDIPESILDRAEERELLGQVIGSGQFPIGDNRQTERFGAINRQVKARRMRNATVSELAPKPDTQPKRYHRA